MSRWLYHWHNGCWAHTLVQYAIIEKHWGPYFRQRIAAIQHERMRQRHVR